ncbi:MAG: iron-sulfur cluster assembly accessory protein [Bacteroidetes bacterium]|nr:iron-sulfur cluster assembly accessory protein [Bacteroidota bacterium]MCW5897274.1 iron-sulfur cluster assembly accessory protein [Bacteroidota bacterium]
METTVTNIPVRPELNEEIVLTEKAAHQVRKLKAENSIPEHHGLRLGVKGGGCSGMTYVLAFDEKPKENDKIMEQLGIQMFVDPKSLFFLSGTVLDFSDGLNGKGFVFNNPQAAKTCGCGQSFGV